MLGLHSTLRLLFLLEWSEPSPSSAVFYFYVAFILRRPSYLQSYATLMLRL